MTARTLMEIGLAGVAITVSLIVATFFAARESAPTPSPPNTTITTTVTTPVAPCHHEDCPPWPSLDQGDNDQ